MGRIGRRTFFLKGILPILGLNILAFLIFYAFVSLVYKSGISEVPDALVIICMTILIIGLFLLFWVFLVLMIKRLHDLGRSGWNVLLWLIPLVGQFINLWNWIEFLFMKGVDGPNQYGNWTD